MTGNPDIVISEGRQVPPAPVSDLPSVAARERHRPLPHPFLPRRSPLAAVLFCLPVQRLLDRSPVAQLLCLLLLLLLR